MWRVLSGLWMGWGLGANDAANVFATGVAAKVIRYRTATILIAIFVMAGAVLEGPKCMDTLGKLAKVSSTNEAFTVMLATAICVTIMSFYGLPISTSQAVVGSILGSVIFKQFYGITAAANPFKGLGKIFLCWVGTPIGGLIISFLMFYTLDRFIDKYITNIIALDRFIKFSLIFAGCYGSYCLGANNVANTTAIYVGHGGSEGMLTAHQAAFWGGLAIALGAVTFSRKVMMTVGEQIAVIGPLGALVATVSHSLTVHFYTQIGVPVSSSQAIVGSVIGIGIIKSSSTVSMKKIFHIVIGWILTPLSSGVFCFLFIWILTKMGLKIIG